MGAALALLLAARVVVARAPFEQLRGPLLAALAALAAYGGWMLASAAWSDAPARAALELSRLLVYLLAFLLVVSVPLERRGVRLLLRGMAAGILAVCSAGLVAVLVSPLDALDARGLSYPVGYHNALGLLAAIGTIVCLHLALDSGERAGMRALWTGALPLLAAALVLTLSVGALAVCAAAIALYVVVAERMPRQRAVVASAPITAIVVLAAVQLSGGGNRGAQVGAAVGLGACLAGVLLSRSRASRPTRRLPRPGRTALAAAAVLAAGLIISSGSVLEWKLSDEPAGGQRAEAGGPQPFELSEVTDLRDRGRVSQWEVALRGFSDSPLLGEGAGTYELLWDRHRPAPGGVMDAHSLYLETLGETGIVGLALLGTWLVASFLLLARGRRRLGREWAVVAAVTAAWALHAAIDWDWEMPVVTLPVFAVLGFGLASAAARAQGGGSSSSASGEPLPLATRALAAGALAILAAAWVLLAVSQAGLNSSVRALEGGDCGAATRSANSSISAAGFRPEPYEVLAYCQAASSFHADAVSNMQLAVDRDPGHWRYRYGLAVIRAAAGLDPRPAIAAARDRNPLSRAVARASRAFDTPRPDVWRRQAAVLLRRAE